MTESNRIGMIATPKNNACNEVELLGNYTYQLVSGSGRYDRAICVSENPFVLVSEWGDMRWNDIKPEWFEFELPSDPAITVAAFERLKRDGDVTLDAKYFSDAIETEMD